MFEILYLINFNLKDLDYLNFLASFESKTSYINVAGTVFAYGVTSSGKTHTMHVSFFPSTAVIFLILLFC